MLLTNPLFKIDSTTFFSFLFHSLLIYFLLRVLYKHSQNTVLKKYFWYAVGLKIIGGVGVGLIYTHFYTGGDTLVIFQYGQQLAELFYESPSKYLSILRSGGKTLLLEFPNYGINNPRAFFMFKISSVLVFFTFGNYWLMATYCSLFSFWGMWLSAHTLLRVFPKTHFALLISRPMLQRY